MNLRSVVDHYIRKFRRGDSAELASFRREPTLVAAVARAALAEEPSTPDAPGRRYPHQYRLKRVHLETAQSRLLARVVELEAANTFDAIFEVVEKSVGNLEGIGELYVYDTALRIGAKKSMLPEKRVYLHTGTRDGARALGLNVAGKKFLLVFDLPTELRRLPAHEIEDVLCIYKAYFAGDTEDLDDRRICRLDDEGDAE